MLQRFGLENITKSASAAGVEIVILPDATYVMNLVILKKNKNELIVEKKQEGITSFQVLAQQLGAVTPFVLLLNGKGIIHRKVSVSESDVPSSLLSKVLPNANVDDFILQQYTVDATHAFISVVRAEVFNTILEELKKIERLNIAACVLGPFVMNNMLPLISDKLRMDNTIRFSKYILSVDAGQITDLVLSEAEHEEERMFVAGEYIHTGLLLSYAAAINYFVGGATGVMNSEMITEIKESNKQKQQFVLRGWVLLVASFAILMINYFVFNYYWQMNREISALLSLNQSGLERYEKVKQELEQKKAFLQQNDLLESSRASFYSDRLAVDVPVSIQWTDVTICPMRKKQTAEGYEEVYFESENIFISGKCKKSVDLNDWIKQIKQYPWVNTAALADYKQDSENEYGLFVVKVELKK